MSEPRLSIVAAVALLAAAGSAQTVVSPDSRGSADGSSSTSYPLGRFNIRMQQLHADLPASMSTIRGHAYRRDAIATNGTIAAFKTELEVQMSVAQNTPDAASSTFAQNRGPSPVVVLPRQLVSFPTTDRPVTAPALIFEYSIPYTTPFQRPAGADVCLEMIVYGNQTQSGNDRNFTAYLDAHTLTTSGSSESQGYRFGNGCTAPGLSTSHYARFEFDRSANGALELRVESRYGVPTPNAATPSQSALLLGMNQAAMPWPWLPACTVWTSIDALLPMPGAPDASGHHDATFAGLANLAPGMRIYAQVATGNITTGDLSFSDGSIVTVPGVEAVPIQVARIAAATNRDATTGTRSFSVPVTEFF